MDDMPAFNGDIVTAIHLCAGISLALVVKARSGKGQLVSANFLRSGFFGYSAMQQSFLEWDPRNVKVFESAPEHMHARYPIATANSYVTKDGWRLQLLGVELPRHLPRLVTALGISKAFYLSIVATLLFKVLPARTETRLMKVVPLFAVLNNKFREEIVKYTRAELEVLFVKHDVWWCPINTVAEAKGYVQTKLLKVVQGEKRGKERISAPFYFDS